MIWINQLTLIDIKEYKIGALVRPSKLANDMFDAAETLFRSAIDSFATKTKLTDLIGQTIVKYLKDNFPQASDCCHLEKIFMRFAKIRHNFYGEYKSSNLQVKFKETIASKQNASKTSKAVSLE